MPIDECLGAHRDDPLCGRAPAHRAYSSHGATSTRHPLRLRLLRPRPPRLRPIVHAVSIALCGAALYGGLPRSAPAQTTPSATPQTASQTYQIPAGPLAPALRSLASTANLLLTFTEGQTDGRTTTGLSGEYTPQAALAAVLAGTGLQAVETNGGAYTLRTVPIGAPTPTAPSGGATLAPVRISAEGLRANDLPTPYAGGLIARGSRVGMLGNRDVMDTPFNITSYTAQTIEDQQATSVMAVLRNDPSVRAVFPDGGLGQYFNVRGYHTQSHELAWNGLYGMVPHNRTPTEFLERVEVLKGPGALLYGMSLGGGVGGVVNLVPKRARATPLTRLTTTYVSDANLGAHLDLGRRFGQDQAFGVRINALRSHGDLAKAGQSEGRTIGSIALDFDHERVRASVDLYSTDEQLRGGVPLLSNFASPAIPKAPDPTVNQMPGVYANSRAKAAIGAIEIDLAEQWQAFAKYGVKQQKGSGYLNNLFGLNANAAGDFTARSFNINNYFNTQSAEAGVRGRLSTGPIRHDLVLSANQVDQETGAVASTVDWPSNMYGPLSPVYAADPIRRKTGAVVLSSVALSDTLSFAENRYLLTLGLRHQRVRTTGFAPTGAVSASYDEAAVTPAVGLVVRPWTAPVSLYANAIQGLSEGGSVTDATAANFGEVFRPYKTRQMEAGVKWDIGRILTTLSAFQITRPSLIKDAATNVYALDGKQRNRGVEWTIAGTPAKGVRLFGGLSYIDAVTTQTTGGLYDGKQALGVPKWNANLGGDWDLPWLSGLTLTGLVVHTGSQFTTNANTQKIPAWTRADLGLRLATRLAGLDTVFRANLINAFDRRYWEGVYSGYATVGIARTLRLSMQVDF